MENGSDDPEYGARIRGWQGPPKGRTDLDQVWWLQGRSDLGYEYTTPNGKRSITTRTRL